MEKKIKGGGGLGRWSLPVGRGKEVICMNKLEPVFAVSFLIELLSDISRIKHDFESNPDLLEISSRLAEIEMKIEKKLLPY